MSVIGEIKTDVELGKGKSFSKFIYQACADCGKERWVEMLKGKPTAFRCRLCGQHHRKLKANFIITPPVIGEIRKGREIGKQDRKSVV